MLILSTVLAMAAPSLRGFFTSRRLDDAAAQILALTQFARSQAISEGIVYRLNFDTRDRTYWLTAQKAGVFESLETGGVASNELDVACLLGNRHFQQGFQERDVAADTGLQIDIAHAGAEQQ